MNSRERVLKALRREQPDRVPLQFDLSAPLLAAFSARTGIEVHYTRAWFEDITYRISGNALRVAMGSDCVVVGPGLPRGYHPATDASGAVTNEFGMVMRQGPHYMELIGHPLAHVSDPAEVADFPFPDPLVPGRLDDAEREIAQYKGQSFIWGDIEGTIWALARHLVGMSKLMVDMAERKPYVEVLFDRCMAYWLPLGREFVRLGVDGIWAGDDFGTQRGLMMSPRMWRHYFKERYRQIYSGLKEANPDIVIAHHCDGAVAPILNDWIEAGLEVFNPVQPNVPGHEPEALKRQFGDRLAFWGGVDQQDLLPNGTTAQIKAEVSHLIETLGAGGGYLAAPAHIIQPDTSVENVIAFIDGVVQYGTKTSTLERLTR
jgi:uroporphyrinogen decarboxylase